MDEDIYCQLCFAEDDDIRYYEDLCLWACRSCYLEDEED